MPNNEKGDGMSLQIEYRQEKERKSLAVCQGNFVRVIDRKSVFPVYRQSCGKAVVTAMMLFG